MDKLANIIRYIVSAYPNRYELSLPRLIKILYLVDYSCVKNLRRPITGLSWYNGYSGPDLRRSEEVDTVQMAYSYEMAREHIDHFYSPAAKQLTFRKEFMDPPIPEFERLLIDDVLAQTYPLSWDRFTNVILHTEPVRASSFSTWITLDTNEEGRLKTVAH